MIMQTQAGTSCLAQTPQLSTHIPPTFSHKFKCEVKKTTALYFQKIKKLTIKRIPRTISEEITKQGLLFLRDFQFAKEESVRGSIRNLKKKSSTTAKPQDKQTNKQNSNNKNKIALKTENRMQNHQNI